MTTNPPSAGSHLRKTLRRGVLGFLAAAIVLGSIYTWATLHYDYATGEHSGYLVRVSRRGLLCKTWEGEIDTAPVPGAVPEKIFFSIRDDATAHELERYVGRNVRLSYARHVGVPSTCFGETEFFVSGVRPVE